MVPVSNLEPENPIFMVVNETEQNAVDHDTYIITRGFDSDVGDPPPGRRPGSEEKAFDRMMEEVRDRYQRAYSDISIKVAFSGVLITISAAILMELTYGGTSTLWAIGVISSTAGIVCGLVAILSSAVRTDGIGIDEIVEVYNHNNYELVSYVMFNNRSFMAQLLEEVNQKVSGIQRMQVIAFAISLMVVLIPEVKA